VIERLAEHGGNVTFTSYEHLEAAFADKVTAAAAAATDASSSGVVSRVQLLSLKICR